MHVIATILQGRFYYPLLTGEKTETQEFLKTQVQYPAHHNEPEHLQSPFPAPGHQPA